MKYFTIKELCKSETAERLKIDNTPPPQDEKNLVALIENVLDPAREELGKPIRVTSGFRGFRLNKAVGGVKASQHCIGMAADLVCEDTLALIRILEKQARFDQLIWEKGKNKPNWVHVSFNPFIKPRGQKLKTLDGKNYVEVNHF